MKILLNACFNLVLAIAGAFTLFLALVFVAAIFKSIF